jgi:hypothetical protein
MEHNVHEAHDHTHGEGCGHTGVRHDDHVDYLHDGHLHSAHGDHVDEHALPVSARQPADCTSSSHDCGAHGQEHAHGDGCGHEAVPHGDHSDYLVDQHLHHHHGDHCDAHGEVALS